MEANISSQCFIWYLAQLIILLDEGNEQTMTSKTFQCCQALELLFPPVSENDLCLYWIASGHPAASCVGQKPTLMSTGPTLCARNSKTHNTGMDRNSLVQYFSFFSSCYSTLSHFVLFVLTFDPRSWQLPWETSQSILIPVHFSSPSPYCQSSVWCCAFTAKTRTSALTFREYTGITRVLIYMTSHLIND